ncbi:MULTISPECIES: response regulator [unclassified Variovorax]|uniref:response regulator n=1 Tax=unclassified Variovorax TaxID=663243 RepID=UPI0008C5CCD0|nr:MULTISPECIES: response regulator [unclassified Variovorax]SEK17167.1 hypothetical protein SAMN05518853_1376 [Variovorax sp. OK202]SFE74588.1 hypothetical protein SAMN05444746_1366 [Variovorax sp. OK212]
MVHPLIVDDDDAFRDALGETLQGLGHETVTVANGAEAWPIRWGVRASAILTSWRHDRTGANRL